VIEEIEVKRTRIMDAIRSEAPVDRILVMGWVRTKRDAKTFSFLEINDGSCRQNLQVIAAGDLSNYEEIDKLTTGSAVSVAGKLVESPGSGQRWEVQATQVEVIGRAPETYPLQKKRHSDEYLRTIAHLRPRTNKYGAVFRIRSELAYAIHKFFKDRGFKYIHTPILTGADCEGAGELFQVTTLQLDRVPKKDGHPDYAGDFFGSRANLTVSGQLSAEMFALALGEVYTFGPTFRADKSNTRRHAAEFWMVEPEMAFCDLEGNMDLGEELIKDVTAYVLETCADDLELFARFVDKGLLARLEGVVSADFVRLPYRDAVEILRKSGRKFEYPAEFGKDLQSEHERFLTEDHFRKPVIVFDYPKGIKPFYMRVNDDRETVAAVDLLVPQVGEIIGGSQREERLAVLEDRMDELGLNKAPYWWYVDSRRYGSVPHSGFGLGFERLLMFVTGITNIRDVIPFPRTPYSIDF
jgi:asparaginyl-tRNA synthetase